MEDRLIIGMPAGSLANPGRGGNLIALLEQSGFKTKGYEDGGPSSFPSCPLFMGWDGRPQEFGCQLGLSELDVAIAGDDWIRERQLELKYEFGQEIELMRVLPLNRGNVRLVGIVDASSPHATTVDFITDFFKTKKLLTVATEMPYTALEWILSAMKKAGISDDYHTYSVQKYKTPPRIDKGILIYETWGKTEAKIKNEGTDIGLEITQSGSALRNYGLKIIETVFESQSSIWINAALLKNKAKAGLLEMFLVNLNGALNAETKVLLLFNVKNSATAEIEKYLGDNKLFGNEPTINRGKDYSEYSIQLDTRRTDLPIAMVRYKLTSMGASSIDTIPLLSSIPGRFEIGK
jgi:ATP phosphoribosyltransferase